MLAQNLQYAGITLIFAGILILALLLYLHGKNPKQGESSNATVGPITFGNSKPANFLRIIQFGALLGVILYSFWLFYLSR